MAHVFEPCTWETEWIAEFEFQCSQVYTKKPCLKKPKQNKTENKTKKRKRKKRKVNLTVEQCPKGH